MKYVIHALAFAALVAVMSACTQTVPPPSSSSASGVLLVTENPCPAFQKCADTGIYFARLTDSSDLKSGKLFPANLSEAGFGFPAPMMRYYALNVEPGTCVVVGTRFVQNTSALGISRTHFHTMLSSQAMIEKSKVDVKAGQIGFMGKFDQQGALTASTNLEQGDDLQRHYAETIKSADKAANVTGAGLLPDDFVFYMSKMNSADQSEATRKVFASSAHKDIEGAGWKAQLDGWVSAGG